MAGNLKPASEYPTVYGFWTNKGGVGKTTLTFHMATTYAELFPNKAVVAIDMCPQCSLSDFLLTHTREKKQREPGDMVVEELQKVEVPGGRVPKTVGGYLRARAYAAAQTAVASNAATSPEDYLVRCSAHNPHVPENMWLMCGDVNLDQHAQKLGTIAGPAPTAEGNSIMDVHYCLRNCINDLQQHFAQKHMELLVFIDTSPVLSIYTQIALCAMTQLVIPASADTFSTQAANRMYNLVYGLYPTAGPAKDSEAETLAHKVKKYGMKLPKIAAIVDSRNPILMDEIKHHSIMYYDTPPDYIPPDYKDKPAKMFFDGYIEATKSGELERVFRATKQTEDSARPQKEATTTRPAKRRNQIPDDSASALKTPKQFADAYVAAVTELRGCGVAAAHHGFPVWELVEKYDYIDRKFKVRDFENNVPWFARDMLAAMKLVLDDAWADVDPAARLRLEGLHGAPQCSTRNCDLRRR